MNTSSSRAIVCVENHISFQSFQREINDVTLEILGEEEERERERGREGGRETNFGGQTKTFLTSMCLVQFVVLEFSPN